MNETIETRELFVLDGLDLNTRGTYHKTHDNRCGAQLNLIEPKRIGILFLNSASPTRAEYSDAAVYLADSFAEYGYPSFRLDLPGFGDSEGDTPTELLGFISHGGYASIASVKIRELLARFNLSGVVLVGQCAGAVSAIYTADAISGCRGLVLLDPYFHLPHSMSPKIRGQLHLLILQSRLGGVLRRTHGLLKEIRLFLRGNVPPENANLPLLRRWKEVACRGLPILILKVPSGKAHDMKPRIGEFDYVKYILGLAGRRNEVIIKLLDGADHSFTSLQSRVIVRQRTEEWLNTYFPLVKYEGVW